MSVLQKEAYSNRFSVGFTDTQFGWLEAKRIQIITETNKWISRADFFRSLVFEVGQGGAMNDGDTNNKASG